MAACYDLLGRDEAHRLLSRSCGIPIARTWISFRTLFLELGKLDDGQGQLTFMLDPQWRVERPRSIDFGSHTTESGYTKRINSLLGLTIETAAVMDPLPELELHFSDGRRLRTFECSSTQPGWSLGFHDTTLFPLEEGWKGIDVSPWLQIARGYPEIQYCYDDTAKRTRQQIRKMGFGSS